MNARTTAMYRQLIDAKPALAGTPVASPRNLSRFPCSSGQRRLWVLDRIDPGNPALNIAVRWRLEGRVPSSDLDKAFALIIARHPSLRTFIAEEDGEPLQVVTPELSFHIPEINLGALSLDDAMLEAERIARLEARASFDLATPPLIRVTQLRIHDSLSIILLTVHHIVCDHRSLGILAHEMDTICTALGEGRTPQLPLPAVNYGEYSIRKLQQESEAALRDDEAYWHTALQDLGHFELYPDHPRPPAQTTNGDVVSLLLGSDVIRGLQDISRRQGSTLFMTALATLFTLLHRYSGERDIAVGCQVDGRDEAGQQDVVGPFINTVVLRGKIEGDPEYAQLLAQVRDMVMDSFAHGSTPLNRLIEILQPKRDLSRNALFSVNFTFQEASAWTEPHAGFRLVGMPAHCAGALFDLNFMMVEGLGGWCLSCEFNTDLFEPETADRLISHFANLLRAVATDPSQTLSSLSMLDGTERRALIIDRNPDETAYPKQSTVPSLFADQARRTPDAVALLCGGQQLSYRELDLASNRLAHELHSRGVGHASRVGICLDRSPDLVVALLAVLKSGAAYIPLDPGYPEARLAHIVENSQPVAIVTKRTLQDCLPQGAALRILLDREAAVIERQPCTPPGCIVSPEDVAYVIYTSGSTGRPKGVQIQHQALTNFLWSMRQQPGLAAEDTLVSVTTISFDIAALELFLPLIVGARLVVAQGDETGDGDALLRLLRRHGATVMQATPVTWQIMLAAGWQADPPLKMLCGGEAMARALAGQLLSAGGELWNLYGPTETTIWSSVLRVAPGPGPVLIGPPIANTQFYVLDPEKQLVPTGAPGELYIGGDGVALGYLNLPEMTDERFIADPFRKVKGARLYRTGDRVRMKPGGNLEFLGRYDHQIKLRGFRIELGEIESVLRAHPQVSDCAAVVALDASGESAIQAYVVAPQADPAMLTDSLKSSLHQTLPNYMCPSAITVLALLPRTPNGKLDRASLPKPGPVEGSSAVPPRPLNAMEQRLAAIWGTVLGAGVLAQAASPADANFFEVGGHSLLAMRLLARIEAEFGQRLSLAALFKAPTVAEQARLLEKSQEGDLRDFDFRQVLKLQPNGSRPPLIAINNTGNYYLLSKCLGLDQPFTSLQLFDPSLPPASLPRTLEAIAAGYVQLIRRVQPTGPYALLGWCVAGTLAFEVARQLNAAGQEISQLVLFDTQVPGYLKRMPWPRSMLADYSYRWQLIFADWRRANVLKQGLSAIGGFLANRDLIKKLRQWFGGSTALAADEMPANGRVQGQWFNPGQYDQWLLRYLEDAAESYQPQPYAGTMTLFRSSQEPAGLFLDPQLGWGGYVEGGVEVIVIDGDHFSIFQEPRVSQMAQCIESALDARLSNITS